MAEFAPIANMSFFKMCVGNSWQLRAQTVANSYDERGTMPESEPIRITHKMRVKLLIKGEEAKSAFDAFAVPDGSDASFNKPIEKHIRQFSDQRNMFIASISVDSNSIDAARVLSDLRDNVLEACGSSSLMLEDGPSEKFEQVLYELISTFERRFRELLIVGICNEKHSLDDDLISKLGEKTLGELFVLVFTDPKFNKTVREMIKNSRPYEKRDLVRLIGEATESSVWSHYFSDADLSTVAKEHDAIRIYRNDVMHAHKMTYQEYKNARMIVERANKEMSREISARSIHLDVANIAVRFSGLSESISKMMDQLDLSGITQSVQTVQQAIAASALGVTQQQAALSESLKPFLDSLSAINAYNAALDSLDADAQGGYTWDSIDAEGEPSSEDDGASMSDHSQIIGSDEGPEGESPEDEDENSHSD